MSEDRSGSDISGYNMTKFDGGKEALVLLNFAVATQDFAAAEYKGWKKLIEDCCGLNHGNRSGAEALSRRYLL